MNFSEKAVLNMAVCPMNSKFKNWVNGLTPLGLFPDNFMYVRLYTNVHCYDDSCTSILTSKLSYGTYRLLLFITAVYYGRRTKNLTQNSLVLTIFRIVQVK